MKCRFLEQKVTYRLQGLCPPVSAASLSRIGVVWGVVVSHCGGCVWFLLGSLEESDQSGGRV